MTSQSESNPFRRPGIAAPKRLVEEFALTLEQIPELIRIRVYEGLEDDWIETDQSHYLQAPGMKLPAISDTPQYSSVEEALDDVLEGLTAGYHAAIKAGHIPDATWLLPNRYFR